MSLSFKGARSLSAARATNVHSAGRVAVRLTLGLPGLRALAVCVQAAGPEGWLLRAKLTQSRHAPKWSQARRCLPQPGHSRGGALLVANMTPNSPSTAWQWMGCVLADAGGSPYSQ